MCLLWKWERKHVAPGVFRRKEAWCVKGTALVPNGQVLHVSLEEVAVLSFSTSFSPPLKSRLISLPDEVSRIYSESVTSHLT